jgi:multidrug efflux system outer membrane protein
MTTFPSSTWRRTGLALLLALTGCSSLAPPAAHAPAEPELPTAWQAPLPHGGQLGKLTQWWQQFDDPLLARLIEAGQQVSPSLASARSRIEQSRATLQAADARLGPQADAQASLARGRFDLASPLGTSLSAGLQARWELDLFGAGRAGQAAARQRLDGAQAAWHEARVSLAAEIGTTYVGLRACEAQLAQARVDASSRTETARLTELTAKAGFQAPATAALARASAAQGSAAVTQTQAQCDTLVKSLVALTSIDEPRLRQQLLPASARLPGPAQISVSQVPAQALAQRPDVYSAAREVGAASADATQAEAQRYPSVALAGNIGPSRFESGGFSSSGTVWSLGPLSVTLPLFDGGTRRANAQAAQARYDAALVAYAASLRGAVREVEDALIGLQSTQARTEDARAAALGFEQSYRATEARFRGGLASLFELEDARRNALAAQSAMIDLQRERVLAWIALYRALGGGWTPADVQARSRAEAGPAANP